MICAGIDGGLTKTGVVLLDENFNLICNHLIKVKSTSAQRLYEIEQALDVILEPYACDHLEVFIEGYAYNAPYQRESLAELGGVFRRYFHANVIPYWVIPPRTLKVFVTGLGTAKKGYMEKKTKEKWQMSFKSDDECDAYGLARLGINVLKSLQNNRHVPTDLDITEAETIIDIVDYSEHFKLANTASRRTTKKQRYANKRIKNTTSKRNNSTTRPSGSDS